MNTFVILGGGQDQMHLIRTAVSMGLIPVVYDRRSDVPGAGFALSHQGFFRRIDFSQVEEVIKDLEGMHRSGYEVKGVLTMGCDCTRALAEIDHHFHLPGPSRETAELATDKLLMKRCWSAKGVPCTYASAIGAPSLVLKPRQSSGSRGVYLLPAEGLIEPYAPGPQLSTETILWDDRAATFMADRNYADTKGFLPQVMENGGWYPCSLSESEQREVARVAEAGARALGITRGVAKGDLVLTPDGPKLIEMAARLSGGDFCESMFPLGCGVNYVRQAIEIALGQEPTWAELEPQFSKVVAQRYFFTPTGIVGEWMLPKGLTEKLEIWACPGSTWKPIRSHADRRGVFVVTGDTRLEVQKKIDDIYAVAQFEIDGQWHRGDPREYR